MSTLKKDMPSGMSSSLYSAFFRGAVLPPKSLFDPANVVHGSQRLEERKQLLQFTIFFIAREWRDANMIAVMPRELFR